MKIPIYQVDAFTNKPFKGNPAAVCILNNEMPTAWMQSLAAEMNVSETAFLMAERGGFQLRWFTPMIEVDLCGHATLASAKVLFSEELASKNQPVVFFTRSGELRASVEGNWINLNFPAFPEEPYKPTGSFMQALGINPVNVVKSGENVLVEVENEEAVRSMKPDFLTLIQTPLHGVAVTARADSHGFDFVSRYFAPWVGINEDPVTGSAHSCLGPYWGKRLGKSEMLAFQASRRGGILKIKLLDHRVQIGGQALEIFKGDLLV